MKKTKLNDYFFTNENSAFSQLCVELETSDLSGLLTFWRVHVLLFISGLVKKEMRKRSCSQTQTERQKFIRNVSAE